MTPLRSFIPILAMIACVAAPSACRAAEYDITLGEVYTERPSGPLKADLYIPQGDGPFPGVLVVHGGAWRMGTRAQLAGFAKTLADNGFTAVAISYRLAPKHLFPAQIEDCKEAVRWMRSHAERLKLDPERLGAYGYSAGGQLVALLATTDADDGLEGSGPREGDDPLEANGGDHSAAKHDDNQTTPTGDPHTPPNGPLSTRLQAVVAGGAPCDFRPMPLDSERLAFWLGGSRREKAEQYRLASPAAFVTPDDPPMMLFHGEKDSLVPIESPKAMQQALEKVGVETELYTIERAGHLVAPMDREAAQRSLQFFVEHLQPTGT